MLLAVDTSTAQAGLALCDGDRVEAELIWHSQQNQTVELAPALTELLRLAGVNIDEVQALGVAIGPGSFTALRVGLALVKGLAVSRNLPIVGVPALDVLAAAQPASKMPLAAVLRAGRGRIAIGWYRAIRKASARRSSLPHDVHSDWELASAAQVTTLEAFANSIEKPTIVAGELSPEERQRLARKKINVVLAPPWLCVRRPAVLAELAWRRWRSGQVDDARALAPMYLESN